MYQGLTQADAVGLLEKKIKFADHPTLHEKRLYTIFNQFCQQAQRIVTTGKVKTQNC